MTTAPFSTAQSFVKHSLECSIWKYYQILHLTATTEWHKNAGAHILNYRQPFVSHAIQLRGVEKGEVANGHNENKSNNYGSVHTILDSFSYRHKKLSSLSGKAWAQIPYVTLLFRDRRVAALLFPGLFRAEIILLCVNRIPIVCFLFVPAQKLSGIAWMKTIYSLR